jgi:hypothetical protein
VLGALPKRARGEGPWPAATRRTWASWSRDPAAVLWTASDRDYALATIRLVALDDARMVQGLQPSYSGEIRLRMDALGLTPKGKRDLRYRVGKAAIKPQPERAPVRAGERAHLTAVK